MCVGRCAAPGERARSSEMRGALMGDAAAAAAAVGTCTDPHVLAASLKQFYRKLPEPLIPAASYEPLLSLGRQLEGNATYEGTVTEELAKLLRHVNQPSLGNVHHLFIFLSEVAAYKDLNRMDVANLAIVFAPNITRPESPSPNELAEVPQIAAAIAVAIKRLASVFPLTGGGSGGRATTVSSFIADASVAYGVEHSGSDGGVGGGGSPLSQTALALHAFADGGEGGEEEEPEWWYSLEGEQLGPVTAAELALLVKAI